MQRVIESATENQLKNKKSFIEDAVAHNIGDIVGLIEGQKSLRDFILDLDSSVDWLHMKPPEYKIRDRVELEDDLVVNTKISLKQEVNNMVKAASRYTGEPKSSIVRICIIKQLYENKDELVRENEDTIEDIWTDIRRKFKVCVERLVNELYFNLEPVFVRTKIGKMKEIGNLMAIRDFYGEFKESDGYRVMKDYEKGQRVDDVLKEVKEFVDRKEKQHM